MDVQAVRLPDSKTLAYPAYTTEFDVVEKMIPDARPITIEDTIE
jgi:hypothetical protein